LRETAKRSPILSFAAGHRYDIGVARLYTDLVSLNEDVQGKAGSSLLAQRLYEDNKNQVDQGTQAPIELTRANATVAVSRQALITAEGLVRSRNSS